MRQLLSIPLVLFLLASAGCGRVPEEVKTAMEKQAEELKQIKAKHRKSVDILFEQIRVLQLFILDELEKKYQQQYARGPRAVKLDDGRPAVIFTEPVTEKRLPPSGNPDRDVIAISTNRLISEWFREKRATTEKQLLDTKKEFMKLEGHIEIAQQINQAVTAYVDSMVNMRRKQKELGSNLVKKLGVIPGAAPLQSTLIKLLIPDTQDLEKKLPKPPA
jgi:hypothetical protein